MKNHIATVATLLMLAALAGCSTPANTPATENSTATPQAVAEKSEPISFKNDNPKIVLSKTSQTANYYDEGIQAIAQECGNDKGLAYYKDLSQKFKGSEESIYTFKYDSEDVQSPTEYVVTAVPNKANYKSLEEFKKDFDLCAAGGARYPHKVNENTLVFISSCGSGFSDETNRPTGCQVIKDEIEATITLN